MRTCTKENVISDRIQLKRRIDIYIYTSTESSIPWLLLTSKMELPVFICALRDGYKISFSRAQYNICSYMKV